MAQARCALEHAPSLHDALATLLSGNRADSSTSCGMQNYKHQLNFLNAFSRLFIFQRRASQTNLTSLLPALVGRFLPAPKRLW
jgi:hypothetical protein